MTLRHPITVLYGKILGWQRKEFAEYLKISPRTLEQYENKNRELPEELAIKISHLTGVSAPWLLEGNPRAKPIAGFLPRKKINGKYYAPKFSKKVFEQHRQKLEAYAQSEKKIEPDDLTEFIEVILNILGATANAETRGRQPEALCVLRGCEQKMIKMFGRNEQFQADFQKRLDAVARMENLFRAKEYETFRMAFKFAIAKSLKKNTESVIFRCLLPLFEDVLFLIQKVDLPEKKRALQPLFKPTKAEMRKALFKLAYKTLEKNELEGEKARLERMPLHEQISEEVRRLSEGKMKAKKKTV